MDTSLLLSGKDIAVLMTDGVEEIEYRHPREFLEQHGAIVTPVAPKAEGTLIQTFDRRHPASCVPVGAEARKVSADDFDALLVPGGLSSPVRLHLTDTSAELIRDFADKAKLIAAICFGPCALIRSGILEGRRLTSWPTLKEVLVAAGAIWIDAPAVVDGNLITGREPDDLPDFEDALLRELVGQSGSAT